MVREIYSPSNCRPEDRLVMNIDDNFKLVYQFRDSRYSPPLNIPMDSFNLQIDYYIKGRPEIYSVIMKNGVCVNCVMDNNNSVIKSIFDRHPLKSGVLMSKFTFEFPDPEYPDRMATSIEVKDTGISIKENTY